MDFEQLVKIENESERVNKTYDIFKSDRSIHRSISIFQSSKVLINKGKNDIQPTDSDSVISRFESL